METPSKVVVIGSLNMDIVVDVDRPPQMGETVLGNHVWFVPGGKGANQAVASARLGAQTVMIGAVGEDAFGQELCAALAREGIYIHSVKQVQGVPTGVASIQLSQGDNSIIVVAGANSSLLPDDIDSCREQLEQADVVLLQLEIPLETVLHAAKTAKQLGKTVILNPAPARALPEELFSYIDVLIPNQSELSLLAGMKAEDDQELEQAMLRLLDKGVRQVVTTLGSQGAAYLTTDRKLAKAPSYKVTVVDTTGAGDAFNAGLAYALAGGRNLAEAIAFAGKVAALAVTKLGAQQGMPTREEVEKFAAAL